MLVLRKSLRYQELHKRNSYSEPDKLSCQNWPKQWQYWMNESEWCTRHSILSGTLSSIKASFLVLAFWKMIQSTNATLAVQNLFLIIKMVMNQFFFQLIRANFQLKYFCNDLNLLRSIWVKYAHTLQVSHTACRQVALQLVLHTHSPPSLNLFKT